MIATHVGLHDLVGTYTCLFAMHAASVFYPQLATGQPTAQVEASHQPLGYGGGLPFYEKNNNYLKKMNKNEHYDMKKIDLHLFRSTFLEEASEIMNDAEGLL